MSREPFDFDEAIERTWVGVLESLREEGHDPDEVIDKAAKHFEGWRGVMPLSEPPDGEL